MKKLYVDFDGCISNTIATICSLYNEDFKYYKKFVPIKWWEVNTWDFTECNCTTPEYINTYFNQPRFFDRLIYMDWAKETLDELKDTYDITIVSSGYSPNLKGKETWIQENLPYCKFIGVNLKKYKDKAHVDMSDGIFIDDSIHNLITSNALVNVCFGDEYEWNKDWTGFRCSNWIDVKNFLLGGNSIQLSCITTSHELARELLNRPNRFITATHDGEEYIIENYKSISTNVNSDDSDIYYTLNLKSGGNNIKR